jgi:hypothetical protein
VLITFAGPPPLRRRRQDRFYRLQVGPRKLGQRLGWRSER